VGRIFQADEPWHIPCKKMHMDRPSLWRNARLAPGEDRKGDLETRVLRNRLVDLTLDWELAALTLDAQRYKASGQIDKESLRDSANTYRKCIAELSEALSDSSVLACQQAD
jgi:hypothetical protein